MRLCGGLAPFKGSAKSIEPRIPMATIFGDPGLKLLESFSAQRVEPLLAIGSHLHDAGLRQDTQMSRDAGLLNFHPLDNVADRTFAGFHHLDDSQASWIGERLKHGNLRFHIYT